MKPTPHVPMSYAGLSLDVVRLDGRYFTPLKPICDLFGLRWKTQHEKLTKDAHFMKKSGATILPCRDGCGGIRDAFCIELSAVTRFLTRLNPSQIRAQGNVDAAAYLEAKLDEWYAALHDYEELGIAVNLNHARAVELRARQEAHLLKLINARSKAKDPESRAILNELVTRTCNELGTKSTLSPERQPGLPGV